MLQKKKRMSITAVILAFLMLAGTTLPVTAAEEPGLRGVPFSGTEEQWAELREQAKNRQRRVIYDNDGDDVAAAPVGMEPSIEGILAQRTSFLKNYPVDTISYTVNRCGFEHLMTRTSVGAHAYGSEASYQNFTQWLHGRNTDALQIQIDYARENDIEIFAGIRVNDIHDVVHRPEDPSPLYSPFKAANPQYLTSWVEAKQALDLNSQIIGTWSSYDYTHQAIRDKFYSVVDELLTNYDVDGIFFDFNRDGILFKSATLGQEVTDTERGYMTALFTDIRARAEAIGKQRGRPLLIAVKVPDSVGYCKATGIDLETWLDEELVDLVIGGMHIDPYEDMVAFCHARGAKYYASVEPDLIYSGKVPSAVERNNFASYLANVSAALAAGVDGIQYFNLYSEGFVQRLMYPDIEDIRYENKRYFPTATSNVFSSQDFWLAGGTAYSQKQPLLYPGAPVLVLPGMVNELYMEVGDDIAAAQAAGKLDNVLAAVYARVERPQDIVAKIEGHSLIYRSSIGDVHYFAVPYEALKVGRNKITLSMQDGAAAGESVDTILAGDVLLSGANQFPWRRMLLSGDGSSEAVVNGTYRITDGSDEGRPCVHYSLALPAGKAYTQENPLVVNFSCRVESADDDQSVVLHITDGRYVSMVSLLEDRVKLTGAAADYLMDTTQALSDYQLRITDEGTTLLLHQGGVYQPILTAPHAENRRIFSQGVMIPGSQNVIPGVNEHGLLFGSLSLEGESVAYWKNIQIVRPADSAWVSDLSVMVTYKQEIQPRELSENWMYETTNTLTLPGGYWPWENTGMAAEVDLQVESGTAEVIFSSGGWMTRQIVMPGLTVLSDGQVLPWDAAEAHTRRVELDSGGVRHFHSSGQNSMTGVENVSGFLAGNGTSYTTEEYNLIRNGGVLIKASPGSVVTAEGIRASISHGYLYKMDPTPEGLKLFEDDCTSRPAAGWTTYATHPGETLYIVDSAGMPGNPLVQLVPQAGQYLFYGTSEMAPPSAGLYSLTKAVGIGSGDWTVQMDLRIVDLIRTSPASAADRWYGFSMDVFASGLRWRINWSDEDQISLLGVAESLTLPSDLGDAFHTYTLHYDGNGKLSVGVDGILLGTFSSFGIPVSGISDRITLNCSHGNWVSGTTEVYLNHFGLYRYRECSLKKPATVAMTDDMVEYDGSPHTLAAETVPADLPVELYYESIADRGKTITATAPANAGTYTVTAQINDAEYTGSATATLTITQAEPTADGISGTLTQGRSLADVSLFGTFRGVQGEPLTGTVAWDLGGSHVPAETGTFGYTFTPDNTNYKSVTGTMTVTVTPAHIPWAPGQAVRSGDIRSYGEGLYVCLQGHTTQADWKPSAVPALWADYRSPGEPSEWRQPTGAHDAYRKGDRVVYNGGVFESLLDANVWSPSGYPAGWRKIG